MRAQQSLQRLNAMLSVGMSSLVQWSGDADAEVAVDLMKKPVPMFSSPPPAESEDNLSELRSLQERLAKALGKPSQKPSSKHRFSSGSSLSTMISDDVPEEMLTKVVGNPIMKPLDKRVSSSCSLSTMAPDDVSECGEFPRNGKGHRRIESCCSLSSMVPDDASECGEVVSVGLKKMPRVWSSGSVSSMVSDVKTSIEEDGPVAFALQGLEDTSNAKHEPPALPLYRFSDTVCRDEMDHKNVPKTQNMAELYNYACSAEPPTTMMIRNIPGRYSQHDLMEDLKELGLAGKYDFLYMPMDKGTAANVGYAFINFVDASMATKCQQVLENFRFQRNRRSSYKMATVSVAHLQGLEKNLQHYAKTAVNSSTLQRRRPVVMANIAEMIH